MRIENHFHFEAFFVLFFIPHCVWSEKKYETIKTMAFSDGKSSGKLTGARLSFSLPLFLSIAQQNANNESSGV